MDAQAVIESLDFTLLNHEATEEELEDEEEEIEAKKLDGAPVETSKFAKVNSNKKITPNYHSSVLSRMYNR